MKRTFNKATNSNKNVFTLLIGTTLAQAVPIAITPILTRIYTPEDFGILALFSGVSLVLGAIAAGRYEMALLIPKNHSEALNIAALCFLLSTGVSLVSFLTIVIFRSRIAAALGNPEIETWLLLIPFSVLMIGFFNTLNFLNTRYENYSKISQATVVKSLVMASCQIVFGVFQPGASGLIVGNLTASVGSNFHLFVSAVRSIDFRNVIAARQIIMQAKRYSKFPKLSMPGILAGSLSRELVSILIPAFYSLGALGAFSIARRVLGVPTAAIGSAMSQVYFQEACSERQKTGKVAKSFLSALRKLSLISSILFIPLFFAVEDIFVVFFGENWREAGVITGYMTPYFFIRFICAPLTVTLSAIERNDISLLANISLLASAVGTLFTSHLLSLDFSYFVILYSITMGLVHLFILIVIWILCR